jgi:predicted TIM-barrel fold metal-dependent hydrolase
MCQQPLNHQIEPFLTMIENETFPDLPLSQFEPHPCLTTPQTEIHKPRYRAIDAHNHLGGEFGGGWDRRPVSELLDVMDEAGVDALVDLDGGWGEDILERHLDQFKAIAPERFLHFGGVDWSQWPEHGDRFGEWAAARLREQARRGAQGLKVWKNLGLHVRDQHGERVSVDDPRLDPVWAAAGELHLPVLIHVADPVAFFQPLDRHNERWEELHAHPEWHFPSPPYPPFSAIVEALSRVILRHPGTTFIGAHVGCYAENLDWVGDLLDRAPNFFVDIGARIGELGRQPYSARAFFLEHTDRILFGTDVPANVESYRLYYRFLESQDEYFNYSRGPVPDQGRWYIYGLGLPDEVLQQVYAANARRVLGIEG